MKPVKELKLPEKLVKDIGEEWAGTYVFHILDGREFLAVGDELIQELREENPEWKGEVPQHRLQYNAIRASITFNGESLRNKEIPAKLYQMLSPIALPLNSISNEEATELFLCLSKVEPREQASW